VTTGMESDHVVASRGTFSFLLDTNVVIPLEPTSPKDMEPGTDRAAELLRLSNAAKVRLFLHPACLHDLDNDQNPERKTVRIRLLKKYSQLPHPPAISDRLSESLGKVEEGSNDWVDHSLLEALRADMVHYLITEDQGIHRKARRIGLGERVATVGEAIDVLQRLFDQTPHPPPAVKSCLAHELATDDPVWDSFRLDYPGFDNWLQRCRQEHRTAWRIDYGDLHAAVTIVKPEAKGESHLQGKVLKICSFKVADQFQGRSYGELLLQTIFDFAVVNDYDWLYVTVFPRHAYLVTFLHDFGFYDSDKRTELDELILQKPMRAPDGVTDGSPLEFHIRYAPHEMRFEGTGKYIVPIQPGFADRLLPSALGQQSLFPGAEPCGNGIRKAYLCNAGIRRIKSGDILFFYRSQDMQAIQAVGVVERTVVSHDPAAVAAAAGKRTVYSYPEIEQLCRNGDVLLILFRQARVLQEPLALGELTDAGILLGPPQSIQSISERHDEWLKKNLN